MVCKKCGKINNPGVKFCTGCGTEMTDQETETVTYTPNYQPVEPQNANGAPQEPNYYNAPQYNVPAQNQKPPREPGNGLAIAGMVCGIVSLFCYGFILGILGIVFGAVAKSKGNKGGMATAGIVCGVIGAGLWLLLIISCGGSLLSYGF